MIFFYLFCGVVRVFCFVFLRNGSLESYLEREYGKVGKIWLLGLDNFVFNFCYIFFVVYFCVLLKYLEFYFFLLVYGMVVFKGLVRFGVKSYIE